MKSTANHPINKDSIKKHVWNYEPLFFLQSHSFRNKKPDQWLVIRKAEILKGRERICEKFVIQHFLKIIDSNKECTMYTNAKYVPQILIRTHAGKLIKAENFLWI